MKEDGTLWFFIQGFILSIFGLPFSQCLGNTIMTINMTLFIFFALGMVFFWRAFLSEGDSMRNVKPSEDEP